MGPHPAVAAVRYAVRQSIAGLAPGELVLVACSGGADSLALAAAAAFEARKAGVLAGGVIVDHGLQQGSADVAAKVAGVMTDLGLEPVWIVRVEVATAGGASESGAAYPGPEGAARAARYAALGEAAESAGAIAVLLGHTLDDQAETVLLGLARGSGARSLAGMAPVAGLYRRPLLELRRQQTQAACAALGLLPWADPQNDDRAFARVRVRHEVMPVLEAALGPGVPDALARTARLLRADADALDAQAAQIEVTEAFRDHEAGLLVAELASHPDAIRHRLLRAAALRAGCPAGALSERHILSLDHLVSEWHGQRWTDLPGGVRCQRRYGRLLFTAAPRQEDPGGRE